MFAPLVPMILVCAVEPIMALENVLLFLQSSVIAVEKQTTNQAYVPSPCST